MTFVLRMAARELRASWRRLLFFFVCVAIGVGAIVALRSVIQSVRDGLMREARALIAADVLVSTNRPWTPELRADLDKRLAAAAGPRAPGDDRDGDDGAAGGRAGADVARMVELRGVQAGFPFYGTVVLQGGARVLARAAREPRRAGAAGAADAARHLGRGRAPDRRAAVHDPRRDRAGAGAARRRLQLRVARAGRPRRTCAAPACSRSAAGPATRSC